MALPATVFGQDTIPISRNELLQKAADANLQLKIANADINAARADYRQSNAIFLPSISASATAMATTNPLMAFGSKLNQEVLTASDFNPALLNDPDRTQNFATRVEVQQPLINMDGFYGRQAAKAKMQAYGFQAERTKAYLELELAKAYMQLQLAYKAVAVIEKAAATTNANLKLVENYYKQGILQKTDLLSMQLRMNEVNNQKQYALSNVQNASDYLAFLLNQDNAGKVYKPVDKLEAENGGTTVVVTLPDGRADLQAIDQTVAAYRKMYQSANMKFLPRLNAFGTYELYDRNLFGTSASGYTIGAQLSWALFDGFGSVGKMQRAKADYQKSEIERDQYKAQSQLELNKTNRQLTDAANNVNLARLALDQSKEAYRIRSNRFGQGLEKTTDLLQAETQQSQKELELSQAIFEYNSTAAYLHFLTQ
ncbi:Outer membrane protein TolC [Flavobacterium longum]